MQEGMKGNKIPNQTKPIFLPLLPTLLALSTGVQTPENPSLLQGSAIQPLWSDRAAGKETIKGLSPTYTSPAPSLASPRATQPQPGTGHGSQHTSKASLQSQLQVLLAIHLGFCL